MVLKFIVDIVAVVWSAIANEVIILLVLLWLFLMLRHKMGAGIRIQCSWGGYLLVMVFHALLLNFIEVSLHFVNRVYIDVWILIRFLLLFWKGFTPAWVLMHDHDLADIITGTVLRNFVKMVCVPAVVIW